MKRIGVLGLVLAVAVVISALAAGSASAVVPCAGQTEKAGCYLYGFKSAEYPAEQKAKNTNIHGFEITGAVSLCEKATFNTNEAKAPNPTKPQKTLEVHPVYSECFLSLAALGNNASAAVRTNECNYVLTALEPGLKTGQVQIKCPGTQTIEVESLGVSGCVIKTGNQVLKGVTYKNEAGGKVLVGSEVEKIKYSASTQCNLGVLSGENGVYRQGEKVLGVAKLSPPPAPANVLSEAFIPTTATTLPAEVNFIYPHYYSEGSLAGSTPTSLISWGTIHLKATEGSPTGSEAVCHNAGGGVAFNPGGELTTSLTTGLNGIAGEGQTQAFATFQCEQTGICPAGTEKATHVIAPLPEAGKPGLPWKGQLTEEVSGAIRAETVGVRVKFLCEKPAGTVESEVPYIIGTKKGSAEAEKGQRPKSELGTSALHPGFVSFAGSGELVVEGSLNKVRAETAEGSVKSLGYEAQETVNAKTP